MNNKFSPLGLRLRLRSMLATLALLCCAWSGAQAAATITIVNGDAPNEGFNDPTPTPPVGGNTGTTLGAQRLIAFQHAANIWAATVNSSVPIRVAASFDPLSCDANGAILGAAGAAEVFADFPGAPLSNTWYPGALASKLSGTDLASPGVAHIRAYFNSRLGLFPDCLPGAPFYLGLDRNAGAGIDLVTVLLHELAHGLGFQDFTDESTGEFFLGIPSIWDYYLIDSPSNTTWVNLTREGRRLSAISGDALAWSGPRVTAAVPQVLAPLSNLVIAGPAAGPAAGNYEVGDASFGPPLNATGVAGELMPIIDQPDGAGFACVPLSPANAISVRGNIAIVDRGECTFVIKAKNLQNAGARGMVVAENTAGPLIGLGGTDPSITIPSVRITLEAGQAIKAVLNRRSRTASGVIATLGVDPNRVAGTDPQRRIRMHSPIVYAPGSSVSHYAVDAKPNQLMEPALNADLSHEVKPPRDLTYPLLQDIGW